MAWHRALVHLWARFQLPDRYIPTNDPPITAHCAKSGSKVFATNVSRVCTRRRVTEVLLSFIETAILVRHGGVKTYSIVSHGQIATKADFN